MSNNDSKTIFDELRWVIKIRETLNEEIEDDDGEFPVSIFNVPKPLMASDPDSYTPQHVSIGPYHYLRQELYEMDRHKLAAAKRFQKQLESLKLEHFVDQLIRLEHRIRSCYHKYLNFNGETLVWMMAIDASFLLEFLRFYITQDRTVSSRMSHVIAHDEILKDIVMLENQIPFFVLRKILEFKFSSLKLADNTLLSMFLGLSREISPFNVTKENNPEIRISKYTHLLDFLYHLIVPNFEGESDEVEFKHKNKYSEDNEKSFIVEKLCGVWRLLSKLATTLKGLTKKVLQCRAMRVITWLPWTIISNLPGFGIIKQPVEYLFFSQQKETNKGENGNLASDNNIMNKSPLMEEITIPSVTELSNSGVCFMAISGDISTIRFDVKTVTLYIPTIALDINSEVFLRNLVAYEASTASGPLVFTRYTELMNGIIDTEEDARILREKGVILNHLKSDQEVANLWNGMSKSIKLTRVPFLDKVIEDVNQHYSGRLSIKVERFMKLYVFTSWQILTFLAAIFLLFLISLQVFGSFYRYNHKCRVNTTR